MFFKLILKNVKVNFKKYLQKNFLKNVHKVNFKKTSLKTNFLKMFRKKVDFKLIFLNNS